MAYINFDGHELDIPCGDLSELITTKNHAGSQSISANDHATVALNGAPPTGYFPIGVIALQTQDLSCTIYGYRFNTNDNTWYVDVLNETASTQIAGVNLTAAYIKSDYVI